jgi:hypothetical protein
LADADQSQYNPGADVTNNFLILQISGKYPANIRQISGFPPDTILATMI